MTQLLPSTVLDRTHPTQAQRAHQRAESQVWLAALAALPADSPARLPLRAQIVESHLPLVRYLALRFSGRNVPLDDLIQVASLGLIKAVDRFDPSRGLAFATYATPTIVGEIKRHFRDHGWLVHVPRGAKELQTSIARARTELSQQLGRSPTVAELATRIGVSHDRIVEALDAAHGYSGVSIDVLTDPDSGPAEHRALHTIEEGLNRVEQRSILRPLLASLPAAEREVLVLRFIASKTQSEIAEMIGVSQMQVSRLVARGLNRLRARAGASSQLLG